MENDVSQGLNIWYISTNKRYSESEVKKPSNKVTFHMNIMFIVECSVFLTKSKTKTIINMDQGFIALFFFFCILS